MEGSGRSGSRGRRRLPREREAAWRTICLGGRDGGPRRSFGLPIHDGGSSSIAIRYCQWCGARLP
ncbi:DUF6980 family protein [Nonomuraea rubra]|uniref:DUF6980 family protein n=1 Tax=Nonomuraea rubra TaxID=46180 RepID=UPI003F4CB8F9